MEYNLNENYDKESIVNNISCVNINFKDFNKKKRSNQIS